MMSFPGPGLATAKCLQPIPAPAVTVFLHVSQWDGQIVAGGRLTACAVCAGIFAVICTGGLALPVATHAPAAVYEDSATDL